MVLLNGEEIISLRAVSLWIW